MSDDKEKNPMPTLLEAPVAAGEVAGNPILDALFSNESMSTVMAKATALESLLTLTTRDCRFSEFMREVLMVLMRTVRSEAGSIIEMYKNDRSFFFRAVVGHRSDRVVNFRIPAGKGVVGHVAETRQPLRIDDVSENKVHLKSIGQAIGFDARSMVAVPIIIRGKVFGVFELLNRVGESNYTVEDANLLIFLSEMAARAIEVRLMIMWCMKSSQGIQKKEAA